MQLLECVHHVIEQNGLLQILRFAEQGIRGDRAAIRCPGCEDRFLFGEAQKGVIENIPRVIPRSGRDPTAGPLRVRGRRQRSQSGSYPYPTLHLAPDLLTLSGGATAAFDLERAQAGSRGDADQSAAAIPQSLSAGAWLMQGEGVGEGGTASRITIAGAAILARAWAASSRSFPFTARRSSISWS